MLNEKTQKLVYFNKITKIIQNTTNTYFFISLWRDDGDRSTSAKCSPNSSTYVICNGELFIDPDLDQVTRSKKTTYFTEAVKFFAFRPHNFVIWAQTSVFEEFTVAKSSAVKKANI